VLMHLFGFSIEVEGRFMKETVVFSGTIVGEGQRVECKIRATKTTLDGDSSAPPAFSNYSVMESSATSKLSEGDYEIVANGETIKVRRKNGQFLGRF
jgi:hypothetical protein